MIMQELMDFTILNWNVAGAKYLEAPQSERRVIKTNLNTELKRLIKQRSPHIVTLQEIVRYEENGKKRDFIEPIEGYCYHPFPLIDTESLSVRAKWNKLEKSGGWPKGTYFAQGNAFLFKKNLRHQPVWALPKNGRHKPKVKRKNYVEKVHLDSGLYFGNRDTEPRAALVAHFVYNPAKRRKPLDIFVINVHLTTLIIEREGVPEIDKKAMKIRLGQLDIIFDGIISRYNLWRQQKYHERSKPKKWEKWEEKNRYEPVWILGGDFNFTVESLEYHTIADLNFIDMIGRKGGGTKAKGWGKPATLTLDYIFAGPKYIALDPLIELINTNQNHVHHDVKVSDHRPMTATVPIWR